MRILRVSIGIFVAVALSSCAQLTHYRSNQDLLDGNGIALMVDAKQRAVISARRPNEYQSLMALRDQTLARIDEAERSRNQNAVMRGAKHKDTKAWEQMISYQLGFLARVENKLLSTDITANDVQMLSICAEPSPDGLSAVSASGAARNSTSAASQALQAAIAESAGSIGLRTQSIQLMRDSMYRLCEGYLSGGLGPASFETLHRRFQNSMVAILAIEQLTGAVRPPSIQLSGGAGVGSAEEVTQLTAQVAKSKAEQKAIEGNLETKTEARDTQAETTAAKKTEWEQKLATAKEKRKTYTEQNTLAAQIADYEGPEEDKPGPTPASQQVELEDVETLEQEASTLEAAWKTEDEKLAGLTEEVETLEGEKADKIREVTYFEDSLEAMRFGVAKSSTNARYENLVQASKVDKETAEAIGESVEGIVEDFYKQGYFEEVCTSVLTALLDGRLSGDSARPILKLTGFPNQDGTITSLTSLVEVCTARFAQTSAIENDFREKQKSIEQRELNQAVAARQAALGQAEEATVRLHTANETIERLEERISVLVDKNEKEQASYAQLIAQKQDELGQLQAVERAPLARYVPPVDADEARVELERTRAELERARSRQLAASAELEALQSTLQAVQAIRSDD